MNDEVLFGIIGIIFCIIFIVAAVLFIRYVTGVNFLFKVPHFLDSREFD